MRLSPELRLAFLTVRTDDKLACLLQLLRDVVDPDVTGLTILFAPTRHHCELLQTTLRAVGRDSVVIYGAMDAEARQLHLSSFRAGEVPLLIVTDVAARGIDVPMINNVRRLWGSLSRAGARPVPERAHARARA